MFFHEGTQCDQSCPFNRTDFLPNILRDLEWSIVRGGGLFLLFWGKSLSFKLAHRNISHRQFTHVRNFFYS